MAKKVPGPVGAMLLFAGGTGNLPVEGLIAKYGEIHDTHTGQQTRPSCMGGRDEPVTPDCGTRTIPKGSGLGVEYVTPRSWSFSDEPPLTPSLVLVGPTIPAWNHELPFIRCPGMGGEERIGTWSVPPNQVARSLPRALSPRDIFGKGKRFTVKDRNTVTRDLFSPTSVVISGKMPVTTTLDWKLHFTRVKSKPRGL
jgi:hypothetical protein